MKKTTNVYREEYVAQRDERLVKAQKSKNKRREKRMERALKTLDVRDLNEYSNLN